MKTEAEAQAVRDIVQAAVDAIGEHVECVQIIVSEGNWCHDNGAGNWFARQEMARLFVRNDHQIDQARHIERIRNESEAG